MRPVSRSGLIAIALTVGAIAASTAQASSFAGPPSYPSSRAFVVRPNPDEQVSASTRSGATLDPAMSSRDGVGTPRLRSAFAQLARTHGVTPTPDQLPASTLAEASADRIAAERAAASPSAPLDRFALIKVHKITPTTTSELSGNADPEGFHFGDAAIGAGVMAGLMLLGAAAALAARRRSQPLHP